MFAGHLFFVLALYLIVKNRGTADTVTLVLLFNWVQDMYWFRRIFSMWNSFKRKVNETQRVYSLHRAPQERIRGPDGYPSDWLNKGNLEFKGAVLRYRPSCDCALDKVSFSVQAGEKVGIVGRTGAGKSTLCMALSRIVELESGSIEIDGQDIAKLDIKALRDHITMIPQDPSLFSGSLRFNLDPFDQASDDRILELINSAGLDYLL